MLSEKPLNLQKDDTLLSETVYVYPSQVKRLVAMGLAVVLAIIVFLMTKPFGLHFILYGGMSVILFVYMAIRMFSKKPILTISPEGISSNMTMMGKKVGLVAWADISNIVEMRHLVFMKSIDVHVHDKRKYLEKLSERDKSMMDTGFLIQLAADEGKLSHLELHDLVMERWNKYLN